MRETCVTCSGRGSRRRSGATIESTCPDCKGTGYVLPPAEDLAAKLDAALKRAEELAAQVEQCDRVDAKRVGEIADLCSQVATLTRERDEARAALAAEREKCASLDVSWANTLDELNIANGTRDAAHATMRRVAEALNGYANARGGDGDARRDAPALMRALAAELMKGLT